MPTNFWNFRIDLSDVWDTPEQPSDVWDAAHATAVADAFKDRAKKWASFNPRIDEILEELSDAAEADDPQWFTAVWDRMYDEADADRVWINLWPR